MKTRPLSVEETLRQITTDKTRAGRARFGRRSGEAEDPRQVYLAACASVASALAPSGFRFAKSGPRLARQRGDWRETVSFQSSTYNVAGARVSLSVHAVVWNRKLKAWRIESQTPFATWDRVAGGQLGNLRTPSGWLDWDLADPSSRPAVIADVVDRVRELALPYFDRFQDIVSLLGGLLLADIPCLDLKDAAELILCYLDREKAQALLGAWVSRHRCIWPDIQEAQAAILRGVDLRSEYTKYAVQAAYLMTHYKLGVV